MNNRNSSYSFSFDYGWGSDLTHLNERPGFLSICFLSESATSGKGIGGKTMNLNPSYTSWVQTDQTFVSLINATLTESVLAQVVGPFDITFSAASGPVEKKPVASD